MEYREAILQGMHNATNPRAKAKLRAICIRMGACVVLVASTHAQGQTADPAADSPPPSALWINAGALSYHFDRAKDYNENNSGVGLEYHLDSETSLMVGTFRNSLRHDTNYAAVNWQPLVRGNWKLGLVMGVLDGYPGVNHGDYFAGALPILSYEGKRFGFNLGIIPDVADVDGAVVVQLKMRIP